MISEGTSPVTGASEGGIVASSGGLTAGRLGSDEASGEGEPASGDAQLASASASSRMGDRRVRDTGLIGRSSLHDGFRDWDAGFTKY